MKFSVVVTTYRRYSRLDLVLNSWIDAGADEIILANGGQWYDTTLPIKQILFRPDPGNKIRFVASRLTMHYFVVLADDDVVVKKGIFEDFQKHYKKQEGIYGVIGRINNSDNYFTCTFIRGDRIDIPIQTFFIGVLYFTHRDNLMWDYRGLEHRAGDDLYWHMVACRDVPKYVLPTKNYSNMIPECNDSQSIFKSDKDIRNQLFMKYRRNYE
jgi:glycosyltransferase involved in cell wall biosynthesis